MRGERHRQSRPERLQRRSIDTIEDLVTWMLITLALLTAVLAATVAARRYGEWMHRAEIETRERTQVQAVLLEPAPQLFAVDGQGRAVRLLPTPVPVRYTASDGTEQLAQAHGGGTTSRRCHRPDVARPFRRAHRRTHARHRRRAARGRRRSRRAGDRSGRPRLRRGGVPQRTAADHHGPLGAGVGAGRAALERTYPVLSPDPSSGWVTGPGGSARWRSCRGSGCGRRDRGWRCPPGPPGWSAGSGPSPPPRTAAGRRRSGSPAPSRRR